MSLQPPQIDPVATQQFRALAHPKDTFEDTAIGFDNSARRIVIISAHKKNAAQIESARLFQRQRHSQLAVPASASGRTDLIADVAAQPAQLPIQSMPKIYSAPIRTVVHEPQNARGYSVCPRRRLSLISE